MTRPILAAAGRRPVAPLLLAAMLATASDQVRTEPYVPASDDVVLEVLARPQGEHWDRIRRLRDAVDRNPADPDSAARLARAYTEINAATGEPRYLGYAAAALEPWHDVQEPPLAIWLMRARVDQRLHRFAAAQTDLDALLLAHAGHAEAALLLSTVAIVRSDYPTARTACRQLLVQGHSVAASLCAANLSPYIGLARRGLQTLEPLLGSGAIPAPLQGWALTLAAELAAGLGNTSAADGYYREALAATDRAGATDLYLVGSYADFLIERGRTGAAVGLLDVAPATDDLLIRRAVAAADGLAATDIDVRLEQRMAALAQRADDAHAREQAWYYLHVVHDAARALPYAQRNWTLQHEMRDARLLLEAALEADEPEAADSVVEWITAQQIDHAWLNDLAARWRAATASR